MSAIDEEVDKRRAACPDKEQLVHFAQVFPLTQARDTLRKKRFIEPVSSSDVHLYIHMIKRRVGGKAKHDVKALELGYKLGRTSIKKLRVEQLIPVTINQLLNEADAVSFFSLSVAESSSYCSDRPLSHARSTSASMRLI